MNSQPLVDGWDEMKRLPVDVSEFHTRSSAAPDARVKLLLGVPRGQRPLACLGTAHRLLPVRMWVPHLRNLPIIRHLLQRDYEDMWQR